MKKITMQDVADALYVSRVSVWKVFNDYPGVSEPLRRQIISKAQEMGYLKSGQMPYSSYQLEDQSKAEEPMTISVLVSHSYSSALCMNLVHCIARELAANHINLMYSYVPSTYTDSYTLPSVLYNGTLHGIIILNVYDATILHMLNELKLPKVFLDMITTFPEDKITGDLILLEGYHSIRKITDYLIHKGRKVIGFIGAGESSRTGQDRYHGYVTAMNQNHLNIDPAICLTESYDSYSLTDGINQFLRNLEKMPEAFVCVNDYVANFLLQYLAQQRIRIPDGVAVSGYDGSTKYGNLTNFLTTVKVDTNALGKRLVKQLLYRMNDPDSPYETIYLTFDISYGESTNFNTY